MQKRPREATYWPFESLGHDICFFYRDRSFWLCVVTWFPGCRRLLGRDRGFPSPDIVVFFRFSIAARVLFMSRQCFVLCHDNVATKGPWSQPRQPKQEVRVTTGACSRPRDSCRNRIS